MYYDFVSVPYEITLLSNNEPVSLLDFCVSVPYEITLLSNIKKAVIVNPTGFSTL